MIKFKFIKDKQQLFGLGMTVQAGMDAVMHPYHHHKVFYPLVAVNLQVAFWSFTIAIYRPPRLFMNHKERRANHIKSNSKF